MLRDARARVFGEPAPSIETEGAVEHSRSASWDHGFVEIVTALIEAGVRITLPEVHATAPGSRRPA